MAAPNLTLVPDDKDALIAKLADEARELRHALRNERIEKEKAIAIGQSLTRTMLTVAERNSQQMAAMQEQLNKVALAASLVPSLEKKIEEVGRVADRSAQFCTALGERVDGLAARETL